MAEFIPGLSLSERFYHEAVRPLLDNAFPGLPHSAALIGPGSEVLGFDTEMSSDHNWGPRVLLFLQEDDHARFHNGIDHLLSHQLPSSFLLYPTDCVSAPGITRTTPYPIAHRVEILTVRGFLLRELDFDLEAPLESADWLTFPQQRLRTLTAGAVFHDEVGLQTVRDRFAWYPRDVWLYLLATGWQRIGQEGHLMGRTGTVGDEIGSALIGSRLTRDIMRLGFLMERQYAPYPKWFGSAFRQLECASSLEPILSNVLRAEIWTERERSLCRAYEILTELHNRLGLTEPLTDTIGYFHTRPFRVIHTERFSETLLAQITDPVVKHIAECGLIGSVEQFSDSTDLLSYTQWPRVLRQLYEV